MNATISILFYLKRAKANAQGLAPIFQRITINGKRLDNSTGKFVDPSKWHPEMSKMRGNSEDARLINGHLDNLRTKILIAEKELNKKDIPVNLETLKNALLGTKERQRLLVPIFQEHNNKIKELLGIEYAPGTYERYQTPLKHTKDFLNWKYNVSDIDITKIDHAFVTDYEFYLRSVRKCANNTAVKYIKNFKKIIKLCISNGWLDKDPFVNYKYISKRIGFLIISPSKNQNKYAIIFTADGYRKLFPKIIALEDQAPKLEYFIPQAFIKPIQDKTLYLGGKDEPYIFKKYKIKISQLYMALVDYDITTKQLIPNENII